MLDSRTLKRLFQSILVASVVPGCGGSIDREQFTSNACAGSNDLDGITPTKPVEFMELRQTVPFADPPMIEAIASHGVSCSGATSATCSETFNMLNVTTGWSISQGQLGTSTRFLVFTRGDEVGTVTTLPDLKSFLAPVDNARDAVFVIKNELSEHNVICDELNATKSGDGFNILTSSGFACGEGSHRDEHVVHVSSTGEVTIEETVIVEEGDPGCAIGRRPEGLVATGSLRQTRNAGTFFADAARLEAASVFAFERLEDELRTYRAPRTLVRDARRARNDEVRHARMTRRLAKKNGGRPLAARVRHPAPRSWIEFVKENAVEGCIRECFGALVATYQAEQATNTQIRAAMKVIAQDETRHASLAWRIAKWAEARLSAEEQTEVRALQQAELRRMACQLAREDAPIGEAGLPGRDESLRLLTGFAKVVGLG
jgi:rubrerythrin